MLRDPTLHFECISLVHLYMRVVVTNITRGSILQSVI